MSACKASLVRLRSSSLRSLGPPSRRPLPPPSLALDQHPRSLDLAPTVHPCAIVEVLLPLRAFCSPGPVSPSPSTFPPPPRDPPPALCAVSNLSPLPFTLTAPAPHIYRRHSTSTCTKQTRRRDQSVRAESMLSTPRKSTLRAQRSRMASFRSPLATDDHDAAQARSPTTHQRRGKFLRRTFLTGQRDSSQRFVVSSICSLSTGDRAQPTAPRCAPRRCCPNNACATLRTID
ncbi:hypothetical protein CERSUDRAFT_101301 [Gelatoporia subvermispora B]|uniref:Uncharacterized protein n=1 Tax=Ceriporiopsis subvermispora (strain B) TaxID=914234 RepID=M2QES2_CERS8|nr:hypothetical protein CERSUDRAFT_101301 [Gelatoporia subvermispora B]